MRRKKVCVIGAGPGGLTAAMILQGNGYDVEVFEKQHSVGGRNAAVRVGEYTFDRGPTSLIMKFVLEEVFEIARRKVEDYLDIRRVDPLYRLVLGDGRELLPTGDRAAMIEQIARMFPGSSRGYERYMKHEEEKLARLLPCLQVPYSSPADFLRARFIKAAPYLDAHLSLHQHLGRYFDAEELKLAFTFQAKYLGMSPWKCPATFSIISFIEHSGGIHHPIGGLSQISAAMARVVEEEGGRIHLGQGVAQVLVRAGRAVGVRLESGDEVPADYTIINADFGHAMATLMPPGSVEKWSPASLEKRGLSCSAVVLYLGLDTVYDGVPHHNIVFAPDYKRNVTEVADTLVLSEEPSIYIQNAAVTDKTLAPEGRSTLYILVPVPNNRSGIDWPAEKDRLRDKVLDIAETRGGLTDLRQHIVCEGIVTPRQFEDELFVYKGAVFNLAHTIDQMLYLRPHNQFEEVEDCYLVGGGTHPGSGLPTIYESARISAGLIMKRDAWFL